MTLKEATIGSVERALWILLASVALVLLVACANVANLFLVRSESRQREVAVRRALGASRVRLAQYYLAESLLLAIAGGAVGLALAAGAVRLLVGVGPATLPRLDEIALGSVSITYAMGLSLLAALLFGAIPLFHRAPLAASLHESGRGNTASRGRHLARQCLMGGQVALALVLLVTSGLMVRSFQKLRAIDPGFDASSALTFRIGLRTMMPPLGVAAAVRRAVDTVDAKLALADVRTLQDVLDRAAAQMGFTMVLLTIAAGATLILGVIGVYGVMSYVVTQRTGEIGVRLALGAVTGSVVCMIVRQGGVVTIAGIAVGLAAAWAGSRLIESLLYGISPRDPAIFAVTPLALLCAALVACWVPARRAARLSLVDALKSE